MGLGISELARRCIECDERNDQAGPRCSSCRAAEVDDVRASLEHARASLAAVRRIMAGPAPGLAGYTPRDVQHAQEHVAALERELEELAG